MSETIGHSAEPGEPETTTIAKILDGPIIGIAALAVIALASIAIRVPFTIQYAREQVPKPSWSSPVFWRTNYVITGVRWAAFAVSAIAGGYGDGVLHQPNNLWTGWIVQIGAILIALTFTEWYPDISGARALRAAGQPTDPPPMIGALLIPMTAWLIPYGILSLAFGAARLGVALILIGGLVNPHLRPNPGSRHIVLTASAPSFPIREDIFHDDRPEPRRRRRRALPVRPVHAGHRRGRHC